MTPVGRGFCPAAELPLGVCGITPGRVFFEGAAHLAILASFCLLSAGCSTGPKFPYQDARLGVDKRTEDLLRRMTEIEKLDLARTGGANARLGIPALKVESAPPASGLALAATWNPEVVARLAAQKPGAFGYYGEDPWLASRMAVAWVGAVQAAGGIAEMLNFPCAATLGVDERALNEKYYPPFRAAIEEAGLWSIGMDHCTDLHPLRDWGFRGFVLPLNSEAPDDSARRILRAMFAAGLFEPGPSKKIDAAEQAKAERIAAEQGIVLLSTESGLLPLLATHLKSIGVTGSKDLADAIRRRAGATPVVEGSGDVNITFSDGRIEVFEPPHGRRALLESWVDTKEAAQGATDVIFGDVNPSGKLPVTLPETRYPFGFGLSYTTFEWSDLRIFPATPRYGQTVQVVVKVRNTGPRAGTETVEVYVHQVKSSLERPPQELKAFGQVELKAGEAKDVAVTLDRHSMSFYDPAAHDWATEPGVFEVFAGASSRDTRLKGSFQLFP